ncbi:hypothetical protein [Saccharothrix longispora]|uniref:YczE/YyaS/YitT family protein n=1 Tax=Saccharothrix longispora TaxID=33920 RepID=UPI0028FDB179|nr:hypothetical protein [Saccharothrix longispora]MDU0292995.1 hypothetical protein [Saccharothrix longispora]
MTGADRALPARPVRLLRLAAGTVLMGLGIALLVRAKLGLLPLDVLHAAISRHTGWTMGGAFLAVQAILLLAYLPLRMRPGAGTIMAATVPAVVCDAALALLPEPTWGWRLVLLPVGAALFAVGIALYLEAGMGALPRDGLMLELHRRRPRMRPAAIRIVVDTGCLTAGWLALGPVAAVLDGTVGLGSLWQAGSDRPSPSCCAGRAGRLRRPCPAARAGRVTVLPRPPPDRSRPPTPVGTPGPTPPSGTAHGQNAHGHPTGRSPIPPTTSSADPFVALVNL